MYEATGTDPGEVLAQLSDVASEWHAKRDGMVTFTVSLYFDYDWEWVGHIVVHTPKKE